jgi:hypothetical protein
VPFIASYRALLEIDNKARKFLTSLTKRESSDFEALKQQALEIRREYQVLGYSGNYLIKEDTELGMEIMDDVGRILNDIVSSAEEDTRLGLFRRFEIYFTKYNEDINKIPHAVNNLSFELATSTTRDPKPELIQALDEFQKEFATNFLDGGQSLRIDEVLRQSFVLYILTARVSLRDNRENMNKIFHSLGFDSAMRSAKTDVQVDLTQNNTRGGIDLNSANLAMTIRRDGLGVPLPLGLQDPVMLAAPGFVPIITGIKPAEDLPILRELKSMSAP